MLDKIRSKIDADTKYVSVVHELGHALVYSILFNTFPKQMCVDTTSALTSGFVIPNSILGHKDSILKNIQVFMAGRAAEEIVFGSQLISMGAQKDIEMANTHAWAYIATLGFDGFIGRMTQKQEDNYVYNISDIGIICEKMIQEAKQKATDVINSNISLFKNILSRLLKNSKIPEDDLITVFKSHGIILSTIGENVTLTVGYEELTKKFLEESSHSPVYVPVVNITPVPVQTEKHKYEKST
jgi:cell division protease FtsH